MLQASAISESPMQGYSFTKVTILVQRNDKFYNIFHSRWTKN